MRRLLLVALLVGTGCMNLDAGITLLKCGGMGGEQNFSRCSWRKTSVFASRVRRTASTPQIAPGIECKKVWSKARMDTLVSENLDGSRTIKHTGLLMAEDSTFTDIPADDFDVLRVGHPYCAEWRPSSAP